MLGVGRKTRRGPRPRITFWEVLRKRQEGFTNKEIAAKSELSPSRIHHLAGQASSLFGTQSPDQRAIALFVHDLKMWHFSDEETSWNEEKLGEVRDTLDTQLGGWVPGYAVTRPPEMRVVHMNPQARVLYRFARLPDIVPGDGLARAAPQWPTIWEGMVGVSEYITNLPKYHAKAIRVAKAIKFIATGLGEREFARAEKFLSIYESFATSHPKLADLWNVSEPEQYAITGGYEKHIRHWDPSGTNSMGEMRPEILRFMAVWTYRPDWRLFQVLYMSIDIRTMQDMVDLGRACSLLASPGAVLPERDASD